MTAVVDRHYWSCHRKKKYRKQHKRSVKPSE